MAEAALFDCVSIAFTLRTGPQRTVEAEPPWLRLGVQQVTPQAAQICCETNPQPVAAIDQHARLRLKHFSGEDGFIRFDERVTNAAPLSECRFERIQQPLLDCVAGDKA